MLGAVLALRLQIPGLLAQTTFSGATFVQKVYLNCTPGQSNCDYDAEQTTALNSQLERVTQLAFKGNPLPPERVIVTPTQQTQVVPAVNEYFSLHLRPKGVAPTAQDADATCSRFLPPGLTQQGTTKILGYEAVRYISSDGWTSLYFPGLGCATIMENAPFKAQPGHAATTTVYVTEKIMPSADPALFAPNPGMVDTLPSEVSRSKMQAGMIAKGVPAAEAQARSDEGVKADKNLSMMDANWRKYHPQ